MEKLKLKRGWKLVGFGEGLQAFSYKGEVVFAVGLGTKGWRWASMEWFRSASHVVRYFEKIGERDDRLASLQALACWLEVAPKSMEGKRVTG